MNTKNQLGNGGTLAQELNNSENLTPEQKFLKYFSRGSLKSHWQSQVTEIHRTVGEIIDGMHGVMYSQSVEEQKSRSSSKKFDAEMVRCDRKFFEEKFNELTSRAPLGEKSHSEKINNLLNLLEAQIDKFFNEIAREFEACRPNLKDNALVFDDYEKFKSCITQFKSDIANCRACLSENDYEQAITLRQSFLLSESQKNIHGVKQKKSPKVQQDSSEEIPVYRSFVRQHPHFSTLGVVSMAVIGVALIIKFQIRQTLEEIKSQEPASAIAVGVDRDDKNPGPLLEKFDVLTYEPNPAVGRVLYRAEGTGKESKQNVIIIPSFGYDPDLNQDPKKEEMFLQMQVGNFQLADELQKRIGICEVVETQFSEKKFKQIQENFESLPQDLRAYSPDELLMVERIKSNPKFPFYAWLLNSGYYSAYSIVQSDFEQYVKYQQFQAQEFQNLEFVHDPDESKVRIFADPVRIQRKTEKPHVTITTEMYSAPLSKVSARLDQGNFTEDVAGVYCALREGFEELIQKYEKNHYVSNTESAALGVLTDLRKNNTVPRMVPVSNNVLMVTSLIEIRNLSEELAAEGYPVMVMAGNDFAGMIERHLNAKSLGASLEPLLPEKYKYLCEKN